MIVYDADKHESYLRERIRQEKKRESGRVPFSPFTASFAEAERESSTRAGDHMSTITKALAFVAFILILWFIWSPSFASMFMPPIEIVWDKCAVRFEPSRDKQFFYQFLIRNKSDSAQEAELVFTPTLLGAVEELRRYQDQNRTSLRLNPNELRWIEIPENMQPGYPKVVYGPEDAFYREYVSRVQSLVRQQLELMSASMGSAYIEPSAGTRENLMRYRVAIMGALIGVYSTIGVRQHRQTKQRPESHDEDVHTQPWRVWEDYKSEHPHTVVRNIDEAEHESDERFRASFMSSRKRARNK